MQVIVYFEAGQRRVVVPAPGVSIADAARAVPDGVEWSEADGATLTPDPVPLPATLSKLAIRDEAVAQGIWSDLKAFIASDADRQERWDLAIAIPTDDPILTDAQAALGWTDAQAEAFMRAAAAR